MTHLSDPLKPSRARIYDAFLGGKDNFEGDRAAAAEVEKVFPTARLAARTNRDFMHRATRFLADQGIRQFLDIGTGIPTEPNLHQVAQAVAPESRVVYVDNDPVVLAHARALLAAGDRTAFIAADATDPQAILRAPQLRETLDLGRPVALSMLALLHFIPDDARPDDILATLLDELAPGSYLVLTHFTADFNAGEPGQRTGDRVTAAYTASSGLGIQTRTGVQFAEFFTGLDLVEPGLTTPHRWRPDPVPADVPVLHTRSDDDLDVDVSFYAGVARK